MVELANLCGYLKLDFGKYFKDYELPKDSRFLQETIKRIPKEDIKWITQRITEITRRMERQN